ncbi:RsiV family protein [Lactobacillus sp. UCMA15818]|uniref:RsiV family protein n=1 Tax=Lactobacillus sp. UCMA15818 TaxID=2583394 RepID=UPI0025B1C7AD|nr:RsiV family protein [Lactobacillus sp. UCMA15818]MDN2453686.1 DUF3298 domain-containing protein [Lactobacillus sp. UCMA15818]
MKTTKDILSSFRKTYVSISVSEDTKKQIINTFASEEKKFFHKLRLIFWERFAAGTISFFAICLLLTIVVPPVRSFAAELPIIGKFVKILTGSNYHDNTNNHNVNIKTPYIDSKNKAIASLNKKYLANSKKKYQAIEKDFRINKNKRISVTSNYKKLVDDRRFLVLERQSTKTMADSETTLLYDTVDKQAGTVVTLPLLFKSKHYITAISNQIEKQIKEQVKSSDSKYYWTKKDLAEGIGSKGAILNAEHSFYINKNHQLVIVFQQFEIAPGYMGTPKFTIPTSSIKNLLVNPNYLNK